MPSVSSKQHGLMEMVAHGGKPKGGKGPPVAVAQEFVAADKGKSFSKPKAPRAPRSTHGEPTTHADFERLGHEGGY